MRNTLASTFLCPNKVSLFVKIQDGLLMDLEILGFSQSGLHSPYYLLTGYKMSNITVHVIFDMCNACISLLRKVKP